MNSSQPDLYMSSDGYLSNDEDPRYRRILWVSTAVDWKQVPYPFFITRPYVMEKDPSYTLACMLDNTTICWS